MLEWLRRLFNKRYPTPLTRVLRIDKNDLSDMTDQEVEEYAQIINLVFNSGKEVLATRKEDGSLDIKELR